MQVTLDHVAVGGNAISNALSTNRALPHSVTHDPSVLCAAFAAKNGVALVARDERTPSLLKIRDVLQHRSVTKDSTRITSVFLHAPSSLQDTTCAAATQRVLAGDAEGNVLLWTNENATTTSAPSSAWTLHALCGADGEKIATDSVSAVTAVQTKRRWLYFAAFSNGHVAVFEQAVDGNWSSAGPVSCISVQKLGVKMIMETMAATVWTTKTQDEKNEEEEDVLVAAGGVDSKVYLFEVASRTSSFKQLIALEGHRGWIRAVDFQCRDDRVASGNDSLFLASASQDHRVRLWNISAVSLASGGSDATAGATSSGFQAVGATTLYTVSFDSLLIAHEDWVTSLVWAFVPGSDGDDAPHQSALISTSMDNTVIVWKTNATIGSTGAWVPWLRVGEHGGNGILSSIFLPSADKRLDLLALNFSGQLERWLQQPAPSKMFQPAASLTGHTSPVTDISWSPRGDYLISLSLDQTTRVLAPWQANQSWHEISRAQVHGYDINCGAFIAQQSPGHNDRFVCGADEKILRIFEAPDDIQSLVTALQGGTEANGAVDTKAARIEHAYLPELSLTNKSSDKKDDSSKGHRGAYAALDDAQRIQLPVGDTLATKSLWPEQRKLYGHGNELLCVASNHAGTMLASACKSREEKFAAVWLWDTSDWSVVQEPLEGHKSSVVQVAFAPNDLLLLSVSKDRHFCVFARGQETGKYELVDRVKAHKRIIWSCSWAPDSTMFATGARDQTVALWGKTTSPNGDKWTQLGDSICMTSAVTAVAFAPWVQQAGQKEEDEEVDYGQQRTYLLAVGLESGGIQLFTVRVARETGAAVSCALAVEIPAVLTSSSTVTRLAWSRSATVDPQETPSASSSSVLASCSSDHSVRLYRVHF